MCNVEWHRQMQCQHLDTLFTHRISYYDSIFCIMDRKRLHKYQTTDKYKRALKWKEYFEDDKEKQIFNYDDDRIFVHCVGVQRNLLSSCAITTS